MKKVYKYQITLTNDQTVTMPKNAEILTVAIQRDNICIWALIDPSEIEMTIRKIHIAGTGHPINVKIKKYIGTILMLMDNLVWHVFEVE